MINRLRKIFGILQLNPLDNAGKVVKMVSVKSNRSNLVWLKKSPPLAGELRDREVLTASVRAARFSCLRWLFFALDARKGVQCEI
jgi:hypothetical protein